MMISIMKYNTKKMFIIKLNIIRNKPSIKNLINKSKLIIMNMNISHQSLIIRKKKNKRLNIKLNIRLSITLSIKQNIKQSIT
jgi:hypothetical protein